MIQAPTRPVMRYYGGKWRLAPQIVAAMPQHHVYVEPFMGAASVFLRKPRVACEVLNDLNDEVVNVFKVLRDRGPELVTAMELTPYARTEYDRAYEISSEPIEMARRFVFRSTAGIGTNSANRRNGFRTSLCDIKHATATSWANLPPHLAAVTARLRGVIIENRPAIQVMQQYDAAHTLHYCDPPYVGSTRKDPRRGYTHEMTDETEHLELLNFLRKLTGRVILSGYASDLYRDLLPDWYSCPLKRGRDQTNRATAETLWMNFEPKGELI
jgi:DNA adenine methylase